MMLTNEEQKEYLDLFYTSLNRCRSSIGLDILSEDPCLSNNLLETLLSGGAREIDDKKTIYKKCELFCAENDFLFVKQELQLPNQQQSSSQSSASLDEAIRFLYSQIFLENESEIKRNHRLTHAKISLFRTQNNLLRSCLSFSVKPLQIFEFSYDTFTESYLIQGKLNKNIEADSLNVYAIKVSDNVSSKNVVIGPGRGEINSNLSFVFRIPQMLLKEEGIHPSNNKCELEFYHKIDADFSHFQHFSYQTVEIDHSYTIIMRQIFHPVHNGRVGIQKSRRDSPDVRRSGSLFKNRLSSSCSKENRIITGGKGAYPMTSLSASKSNNISEPFSYFSERRNKGIQSSMDRIQEARECDFSIYKDEDFRSQHRSSNKRNSNVSFGQNNNGFQYRENNNNNVDFFGGLSKENKENFFEEPLKNSKNNTQNYTQLQNRDIESEKRDVFRSYPTTSQPQTKSNISLDFKSQPNNIFTSTQNPFQTKPTPGVSASTNIFASSSATNIFSNGVTASNLFKPPEKNLFSQSTNPAKSSQMNQSTTPISTQFQQNISVPKDIWSSGKIDLFSGSNSLQQTALSSSFPQSTLNQQNPVNNQNMQIFLQQQQQPQQPFQIQQQQVFQPQQTLLQQQIQQGINQQQIQAISQQQNIPLLLQLQPPQQLQLNNANIFAQTQQNNQAITQNPFAISEKYYIKGVKHTFTIIENPLKLQQVNIVKLPANKERKQKALLDSRGFKDPSVGVQKLKEIEKGYKCCRESLKSDYEKYWNTGEHCDFTVSLDQDSEAFFKLHKVVVGHYSEYFSKVFAEQPLITHFSLKQKNFNSEAVRLMFKWMYFNELPLHEWEEMSFKQAQQSLNCALFTKTWDFLIQIIIKVIIPKMTCEKLIDFLILSEFLPNYFKTRKEDQQKSILLSVFKLLQNYCILFFTNNSLEVIEKTEDLKIQQLVDINSDLIFTLINETSLKFDTIDHLEKLFGWLCRQAPMFFGRNLVELCSFFESQYISIQPFDKIYFPFDKEIKSLSGQNAYTTPLFEKIPNPMKDTPNKGKGAMFDEEDINLTDIEDILLSKKEWPSSNLLKTTAKEEQARARDALFQRDCDFAFQFKRSDLPTVYISEEFYSYSRKWRIILEVDSLQDQNVSVFLRECGQRNPKEYDTTLYNERIFFTSAVFRIEFQERRSAAFDMFYSFSNNQNISVGKVNFCQAKRIADPSTHQIKLKVWIEELKCHGALMHYLSSKLTDLMVEGFNEEQKKLAETEIEKSNKKRMGNNEPVSNKRQSTRVMDALLDKEWFKITAQMDEEGKILSPVKTRTSISRLARENLAYKEKELNLFQLPIFEAFYLLSSNNLNITHEKYALHLLYRLTLNKSDLEIDLVLHGIRFSYLDLEHLLNLARDHTAVKRNKYFQMMVRKELHQRYELFQDKVVPLQKGRNHYDYTQINHNKDTHRDFKQNFLEWLFNSEHHPGFKSEIQKIQNNIKAQMEDINQRERELSNQFQRLKQEQYNLRVKPSGISSNLAYRYPATSSQSTNPSTNNQGSVSSYNSSFEHNNQIQSKNINNNSHNNNNNNNNNIPSSLLNDQKLIYNQNGQPLLNLSNQERMKLRGGGIDFNQGNAPYLSSNKTVENDNCNIF